MSTPRRSASSGSQGQGAKGQGSKDGSAQDSSGIEVLNRQRERLINRPEVAQLARQVLDRIGRAEAGATITFIRDRMMRRLNRDYRGIDAPTDVLSFAYHEDSGGKTGIEPDHLGDVVISVETADRDARQLGLAFDCDIETLVI